MKKNLAKVLLAVAAASVMGAAAHAVTATNTFTARIEIQAACEVTSPTDLDFGTHGLLNSTITATSTFVVKCTNGTNYSVALTGANDSGGVKNMVNGSEDVAYQTYQDSSHSTVWDGSNTKSGTGTGVDQTHTVYGKVDPQTSPSVGIYTDTVTITVSY